MKKFTKEERHEIYKKAKENLGTKMGGAEIYCMCWALLSVIEPRFFSDLSSFEAICNYRGSSFEGMIVHHDLSNVMPSTLNKLFPEFNESLKTSDCSIYWFKSLTERKEAFDEIIEMTK